MSLIFWHAGYGSKGVASISGACVAPVLSIVLMLVATLRSWPLSIGAHVRSGAALHLLRVRSISSSGPHSCECSCLLVLTSTAPWWSERSVPFKLLRCNAILPFCGMCASRYSGISSDGSIHLGMFRMLPLRCRRSFALVSRLAQHFSHASESLCLILAISWSAMSWSAGVHESMSFSATSLLDSSVCAVGFGPSSRLRPSVFHGSVVSRSKASAANTERIGDVPVAVERVCHIGMCVLLLVCAE